VGILFLRKAFVFASEGRLEKFIAGILKRRKQTHQVSFLFCYFVTTKLKFSGT